MTTLPCEFLRTLGPQIADADVLAAEHAEERLVLVGRHLQIRGAHRGDGAPGEGGQQRRGGRGAPGPGGSPPRSVARRRRGPLLVEHASTRSRSPSGGSTSARAAANVLTPSASATMSRRQAEHPRRWAPTAASAAGPGCRAGARGAGRGPRHTSRGCSCIDSRSLRSAVRIRVFAVPRGMPSSSATSALVLPPKYASSSAARWPSDRPDMARRARWRQVHRLRHLVGPGLLRDLPPGAMRSRTRASSTRRRRESIARAPRHQEDPRLELAPAGVVPRGVAPELHEGVLHEVLGRGVVPEHHDAQSVDPGREAREELGRAGSRSEKARISAASDPLCRSHDLHGTRGCTNEPGGRPAASAATDRPATRRTRGGARAWWAEVLVPPDDEVALVEEGRGLEPASRDEREGERPPLDEGVRLLVLGRRFPAPRPQCQIPRPRPRGRPGRCGRGRTARPGRASHGSMRIGQVVREVQRPVLGFSSRPVLSRRSSPWTHHSTIRDCTR